MQRIVCDFTKDLHKEKSFSRLSPRNFDVDYISRLNIEECNFAVNFVILTSNFLSTCKSCVAIE